MGLKTTMSLGQVNGPSRRSGLPADRGHIQNGVEGTLVTMATPSVGEVRYPRCGRRFGAIREHSPEILLIDIILSNGTSTSKFPIQKRRPPSTVTSTDRTLLYQNQAITPRLPREIPSTTPCAPMGTAAIRIATKIASRMTNRILKAAREH